MEIFVLITHLIGTILGVGGATMVELHLHQALKDKLVSADESAILAVDYTIIRVGLILAVLSGFGFLLLFKFNGEVEKMYDPILWAKLVMVMIIAVNAILLQAHKINLYWGAAFSFVSWWTVGILGVFLAEGQKLNFFSDDAFVSSFGSIMIVYGITVVVGAIILHQIRSIVSKTV